MRDSGFETTLCTGLYRPRKSYENLVLFLRPITEVLIEDSR